MVDEPPPGRHAMRDPGLEAAVRLWEESEYRRRRPWLAVPRWLEWDLDGFTVANDSEAAARAPWELSEHDLDLLAYWPERHEWTITGEGAGTFPTIGGSRWTAR